MLGLYIHYHYCQLLPLTKWVVKVNRLIDNLPKETNPPFVLKSSMSSPLNSGGGIGDHVHGGALANASELPMSMSSYIEVLLFI